ncbi:MAG: hypothetical protein QOK39_676, partial [Acidimicrobiaceae bacterium]|nr:hypothetical protein [Acidimicrobiaceae bacterium]
MATCSSMGTVILLGLIPVAGGLIGASPAAAAGNFSNASIADLAISHNGQYLGDPNGQCIIFAEAMVHQASGGTVNFPGAVANGYYNVYPMAGGTAVSLADAKKGDIIQLSTSPSSWYGNGHQHTAIVLDDVSSGPGWRVVDSNWNFSLSVKIHAGSDVVNDAHNYGLMLAVFRFGSVTPPPPPAQIRDTVLRSDGRSGYTLDGFGDVMAFGGAPGIPTGQESLWPSWNIARRLVLLTDNSGYVMEGFGGIHPFWAAGAAQPPGVSGAAYWPNWDIARDIELLPNHRGGYQLDAYGGLHPFAIGGNPLPPAASGAPYWANWDIARAIAVSPAGTGGYVLDGFGGVHPFAVGANPIPPGIGNATYWPNWDIARDMVVSFTGTSGYTLDGFGGVHPFAAGSSTPPGVSTSRYTSGSDLATGLALSSQQGSVSGVVTFSDQAGPSGFGPGVRARKVVMLPGSATAGYTLAGDGTITSFGGAPAATGYATWHNWDIARDMALVPNSTGGYVLDGFGGIHPFAIGTDPAPAAPAGAPYWGGWDIARTMVLNR